MSEALDSRALRDAYGHHPSGVVFVGALVRGAPCGLAASSFVPVSLDPPLVSICVQNTSTTWPRIAVSESLGISVLSDSHKDAIGTLSAKTGDRFVDVTIATSDRGAIFVDGCGLWLEGSVDQTIDAGDHVIVIVRLKDIIIRDGQASPMIFYRSACRELAAEI